MERHSTHTGEGYLRILLTFNWGGGYKISGGLLGYRDYSWQDIFKSDKKHARIPSAFSILCQRMHQFHLQTQKNLFHAN